MERMASSGRRWRRKKLARFWRQHCRPWFNRRNLPYFVLLVLLAFLATTEFLAHRRGPSATIARREKKASAIPSGPINLAQDPTQVGAAWEAMVADHLREKPAATATPAVDPTRFVLPCRGRLWRGLGWRYDEATRSWAYHRGVDLTVKAEEPVVAIAAGEVVEVKPYEEGGMLVTVDHGGGWRSGYGGLTRVSPALGARVAAGEVLGYPWGDFLHLEVERGGSPVDPMNLFPGLG
ncbi:MAG: M23 family metallopeptidase [Firmicutes bacterium]|nr:M23 family metallopeptidase [Bacillota bacterium]